MAASSTVSKTGFIGKQFRRISIGVVVGSVSALLVHLLFRDSVFSPSIRLNLQRLPFHQQYDGVHAYTAELIGLVIGVFALILVAGALSAWRYVRSWWAGIISITGLVSLAATLAVLSSKDAQGKERSLILGIMALVGVVAAEYRRQSLEPRPSSSGVLKLHLPARTTSSDQSRALSSSDDPIHNWEEDLIGRTAVVEVLADHALRQRTPIVALNGDFGDGKTSVLNLLRESIAGRAIVISFSAWLPGSEVSFATDLFSDIVVECRKYVRVPQLRKRALAYARTLSGSVPYLAGIREILPTQSQRQEIEELRAALMRIPLPIVVLLDEVDRMQKEEIIVLLKILRGAASIPNATFICAFSEEEIKKELEKDGRLSYDYLEKFFPVSIRLSAPPADMVGKIFQDKLNSYFRETKWFATPQEESKFADLLGQIWTDSFSHVCTNLRKVGLLFNDILSAARPIVREVDPLDLTVIAAVRRFYAEVYKTVRTNPLYLTYARSDWSKGRYFSEDEKKQGADRFFKDLNKVIDAKPMPAAVKAMLSWIFPDYGGTSKGKFFYSALRGEGEQTAATNRRICNPDYFPIYFRSAVPEDMFSNADLSQLILALNESRSESGVADVFGHVLDSIPKGYPKKADFLWKLGTAVNQLSDQAAEWLAYSAAARAADYAYDIINIGEAAKALNIVFEAAQKLSATEAAQRILLDAMERAADDTFALRLLEYTQRRDRNRILTNFEHINSEELKTAFMTRMRRRYGGDTPIAQIDIAHGDWHAFLTWVDNSPEDKQAEQEFWRRFIGTNRKRLAQAMNFIYPGGNIAWPEDPTPIVNGLFPTEEMAKLIQEIPEGEPLDEIEAAGIARYEALLQGNYRQPGQL